MTKRKKSVLLITAVALSLLLVVGMTLAWLSDTRDAHNIIKIGEDGSGNTAIKMVLDEPNFRKEVAAAIDSMPAGAVASDYGALLVTDLLGTTMLHADIKTKADFEAQVKEAFVYNYMPAQKIKKDPGTKNIGKIPVYLRFKLTDSTNAVIKQSDPIWKTLSDLPTAATPGLGLKINAAFKYNTTDHYYYYETSGNLTELDVGASVFFFIPDATNGHTLEVPSTLGSQGITEFNNALNFKVAAEVVQTEGLNTTAPWGDASGPITLN